MEHLSPGASGAGRRSLLVRLGLFSTSRESNPRPCGGGGGGGEGKGEGMPSNESPSNHNTIDTITVEHLNLDTFGTVLKCPDHKGVLFSGEGGFKFSK